MATIYEISKITGYSIKTVKTFHRHGFLIASDSPEPIIDAVRINLKKGNRLTALQQLYLIRNPDAKKQFDMWYREIELQLDKLGEATAEAIPWEISNLIELAARREPNAIEKISQAIYGLIQVSDAFDNGAQKDHAFIAVRLLADVPEHSLVSLSKKAQACLWQCRRSPILSDCWKLNEKGKTIYFRPKKKALANLDL